MVYKYHINVYWSEDDQAFIAEVPELLGAADGATPMEAVANVQGAIERWIAHSQELGNEVPEPSINPAT